MLQKIKAIAILILALGLSIVVGFKLKLSIDDYKQRIIKENFLAAYSEINRDISNNGYGDYVSNIENYVATEGSTIAIINMEDINLSVSVVEGVSKEDIKLNVGHYPQSDMPWVAGGNFAVAGHSSIVYNKLFNNLHDAKVGMNVEVVTSFGNYYYEIVDRYVVEPTDVSCIERNKYGKNTITMTTCINSGKQRLIVVGEMKKASEIELEKLLKEMEQ